jgi:hypothetical protein
MTARLWFLGFLCGIANCTPAQPFPLDSMLLAKFSKDSLVKYACPLCAGLTVPIVVSDSIRSLFGLKDTVVAGVQIRYRPTVKAALQGCRMSKFEKSCLFGFLRVRRSKGNDNTVRMAFNYGTIERRGLLGRRVWIIDDTGYTSFEYCSSCDEPNRLGVRVIAY